MVNRTKICSNCILKDGFLGVTLNSEELCNFCHNPNYKNDNWSKVRIHNNLRRRKRLDWCFVVKKMIKTQKKQKYGCVLGYSGGKDSTSLLDTLINQYKINPLAVTVDTGFMADIAKENIKDTLEKINVDHIFVKKAIGTFTNLYHTLFSNHDSNKKCLTKVVCDNCSDLLHSIIVREAIKRKIEIVLFGYSPDQISRYFYEINRDKILNNWKPNFINNESFTDNDRRWYIDSQEFKATSIPRVYLPFHVLNYHVDDIIKTIELKKLVKKGNADPLKTNCNVVAAALFYDINRYGGIPYALQYAELVRQNPSLRKEWLRTIRMLSPLILKAKFKEKGVNEFLKKIGILKEDLLNIIHTQIEKDPNKDSILRNIDSLKKK